MPRTVVLLVLLTGLLVPVGATAQIQAPPEEIAPSAAGAAAPTETATQPSKTAGGVIDIAVGIGDQSVAMFDNPLFQALAVKKVRYFIKWDMIGRPGELALADAWVNRATALKQQVLM